ncbi:MAG: tetratricopeptide repeat protein [Ignavibacteriaceae bacterium]
MRKNLFLIFLFFPAILLAQVGGELNNQFMLAQNYIQAGQLEKARPILENLYRLQPSNYEYFQTLNQTYIQLKNYDASIALIEERINGSPGDINLFGLLGTSYYLKGNDKRAFEVWDNALKTFPKNEVNYRVIANYALALRAFDKAIDYLKNGEAISQNPQFFAYDLANLYSLTMRYKEATEQYCFILSRDPNQLSVVQSKILSYINKPDALTQAIDIVKKYDDGKEISFKYLLALLYVQGKSYDKAYDLYRQIDAFQNNQGAELFNFGKFLYDEKIYKMSEKVLRDVINKYPDSPLISYAKLQHAKALEGIVDEESNAQIPFWKPYYTPVKNNSSNVGKVIDAYNEIEKIYPHSEAANEALLRIGEMKLNMYDDIAGAKESFQELFTDAPLSEYTAAAYEQLGKGFLLNGDLNSASTYFEKIFNNGRYSEDKRNFAGYELARISMYSGNFDKAKDYLHTISSDPKNSSTNDAIELSLLMNTAQNDSSNLVTFASAEFLTDQKKFKEALEKFEVVANDPQKFMLQNIAELRVAEMELALNNIDSAAVQLQKIADEKENNIYSDKALYLLAKVYQFGLNNKPKAIETYESLLAKFPNSLYLDDARSEILKLKDVVNNG